MPYTRHADHLTPLQIQPKTNGKAIASLVLGVCAFCVGLCGIIGFILGIIAKKEIDSSAGAQKGEGMAIWGILLGAVGALINYIYVFSQMDS